MLLMQTCEPHPLILPVQIIVDARLFRVFRQRLQLYLDLMADISHAHEIVFRILQFFQGFPLAVAIFRDSRRFLKKSAPILRLAVEDIIDAVLADDAHAVMPDARIREEVVDVLQTAAGAVDIELAFP